MDKFLDRKNSVETMKNIVSNRHALKPAKLPTIEAETLKQLLKYYQEITDTVREPFLVLNNSLRIVSANHAFYKTFKTNRLNTENQIIYNLGDNQWDSPKLRELLENILPKHKIFNDFEVRFKFPDIGPRIMLLNARQISSRQLILLAIEDITKRKKLELDSEQITRSMAQQNRRLRELSDAKDEFLSMASHQLRTPATVVKQYTAMLHDGYAGKLTLKQMNMLDRVIFSNERQLEIIEDLLRVARVEDGQVYLDKTACNIGAIIEDVIHEQLITFIRRKQKVIFHSPKLKIIAHMDEKLMHMVLENLLDNAGKYSPYRTTITLAVSQSKKYTIITIDDAGIGILKADQKKLFKKFSRIDNDMSSSTAGTGLGLYWVKKIVELHGGSIEVKSEIDHGSVFTVKIPLVVDH
jgi:two-component system cell cycle sensor histidine kinase PleC